MSDWDFLYEMNARGCSAAEISDAAACGYAPWDLIDEDEYEDADEPISQQKKETNQTKTTRNIFTVI